MRRTLVISAPAALAVALAWSRVETGPHLRGLLVAALVGLLTALPRRGWERVAIAVPTLTAVAAVAFDRRPWHLAAGLEKGLRDFDLVVLPFAPVEHAEMHALVLSVVALSAAALALTAAARRPLACSALAALAIGWPTTIVPHRDTATVGGIALAVALWPPVASRLAGARAAAPALGVLAGVVLLAVAGALAGVRPSSAAVAWDRWDLLGSSRSAADVRLVWEASYEGIAFPARRTTVLRIEAPRRALYWRASTLDRFVDDHWIENLYPVATGNARRLLPPSTLQPPGARRGKDWVEQRVEVAALVDDHLVAASEPVRLSSSDTGRVSYLSGGVMRASRSLERGASYTVWSAAPRPSPAELVESPPTYPSAAVRYLELDRTTLPPFGRAGRAAQVSALFRDDRYQPLWPYRGVWERARALTRDAASPYEAVVTVERWLRTGGGFRYEERPAPSVGLPPLADFVLRSKQGYCQHFAGAMALMLRLLGIPARVAVGFTSGAWDEGTWTVTDHDAHAWVEVWLAGHGWLPFDPTPGRGTLSASYTNASDSADAIRALGIGRFLDFSDQGPSAPRLPAPRPSSERPGTSPWPYLLPLVGLGLLAGALGGLKELRKRRAYSGDPRRDAAAARSELVGFLRDQGVPVRRDASIDDLARELELFGVRPDSLAWAFVRARYGPPDAARAAAGATRAELRAVLRALRARLGPGRRLRGFLTLRSLRGA